MAIVNKPVPSKQAQMLEEMAKYPKFIGAMDPAIGKYVAERFEGASMKTKVLPVPEATEVAKLTT